MTAISTAVDVTTSTSAAAATAAAAAAAAAKKAKNRIYSDWSPVNDLSPIIDVSPSTENVIEAAGMFNASTACSLKYSITFSTARA